MATRKKTPAKKAPAKKKAATRSSKSREAADNALSAPVGPPATVDRSKFKTGRALSVPMVKFNAGDTYAIRIDSVHQQMMPGANSKTPAKVLRGTNLETGELCDFIAPAVLQSTLSRTYGEVDAPEDHIGPVGDSPWDGKAILVTCSKREEKRYMDVRVDELEL